MMRTYICLVFSLIFTLSVQSADIRTNDVVRLNKAEVGNFFERPYNQKVIEGFEYSYTSKNIAFLLVHDHLDSDLFGAAISDNTRIFVAEMQNQIAARLDSSKASTAEVDIHKVLGNISKHAQYICHICCAFELKKRVGDNLGILLAETTVCTNFIDKIWPYRLIDAEKFYTVCGTDFYKKKTYTELQALMDATK